MKVIVVLLAFFLFMFGFYGITLLAGAFDSRRLGRKKEIQRLKKEVLEYEGLLSAIEEALHGSHFAPNPRLTIDLITSQVESFQSTKRSNKIKEIG